MVFAVTSFVTTAPAATKANFPMLCPHTIVAFAPIDAPLPIIVFLYSSLLEIKLLGFITFVKTHDGPKNTSSSHITPVYTETLFYVFYLCLNFNLK